MKKIIENIFILLTVIFILAGCTGPLGGNPSVESEAGEEGTGFSLSISRYAGWFTQVLENLADRQISRNFEIREIEQVSSRAFILAERVVVTIYDSGDVPVLSQEYSIGLEGTDFECSVTIPPGSGYGLTVDIYNNQVSADEPVVSGGIPGLDVVSGTMTPVSIVCTPNAPTPLYSGTSADISIVPYVLDGDYSVISSGGELWFELTAPDSGTVTLSPVFDEGITHVVGIFDSQGYCLDDYNWYGQMPSAGSLVFSELTPGEIYYLALIAIADSGASVSGSVTLEEIVPVC